MIYESLHIVKSELNDYFTNSNPVVLNNIANYEEGSSDDDGSIFLTLLNIQEEYTLKNKSNNTIKNQVVSYKNPKINLNIYLLFSAVNSSYTDSLMSITKIIEFFQGKRTFTQANSNFDRNISPFDKITNFKFIIDLYTPSFEELNFIWGTLGGKQYPSVIYKLSLIEIERNAKLSEGSLIKEINHSLISED